MSVLRDRIVNQDFHDWGMGDMHPHGTGATAMVMPLAVVEYGADARALYQTLHPLVTADGAVVPGRAFAYPEDVPG